MTVICFFTRKEIKGQATKCLQGATRAVYGEAKNPSRGGNFNSTRDALLASLAELERKTART